MHTVYDPVSHLPITVELVGGAHDGFTWRSAAHDVPCPGYVLHIAGTRYRMDPHGLLPELRTATVIATS